MCIRDRSEVEDEEIIDNDSQSTSNEDNASGDLTLFWKWVN